VQQRDIGSQEDPQATNAEETTDKFLLFNLGSELYGTPLLEVREVIKMSAIKPVPYMVPHFKGVINLRGQIVGIVDLRLKFQLKPDGEAKGMILVIDTADGIVGAIVDEISSVEPISKDHIDAHPLVETKVPSEFFLGVAKLERGLVNLIDIAGCLSSEELRKVKRLA
jgi:purine-binding chemotaxis protein CheW